MTNSAEDLRGRAVRVVTQRLEDLQRAGVTHLAKPQAVGEWPKAAAESLLKSDAAEVETLVPPEKRPAALEIIRQEVAACTRCTELAESAHANGVRRGQSDGADLFFRRSAGGG